MPTAIAAATIQRVAFGHASVEPAVLGLITLGTIVPGVMTEPVLDSLPVAIIGAGPAGLTAAWDLAARAHPAIVFESDQVVGGISRTVVRNGWRFDIGGHRFFTKVEVVEQRWHEILGDDELLIRPRTSRIFYRGRYFDYPLKVGNALRGLGLFEATRCVWSYLVAQVRPPKDQTTFDGWVSARFGRRLYQIFFKTYTEKVWGVPANTIQADWAAQRIKNLSLFRAVWHAIDPRPNRNDVASLIEEFTYPRLGPGQMWEAAADAVVQKGIPVKLEHRIIGLHHGNGAVHEIVVEAGGHTETHAVSSVISSMPINHLILAMDPPPPADVIAAAKGLKHRDFMTIALVIQGAVPFADNWIYIHSPEVELGRIQNFRSWSPELVKPGGNCLGLEYFVNEGDELWEMDDADLVELGKREMAQLGLLDPQHVVEGHVVRMPRAYPMYDESYQSNIDTIRGWLETAVPNVHPVGRNGMHRYNNQDHSMYSAMLTVENLFGADHDIWSINVEAEYHEIRDEAPSSSTEVEAPQIERLGQATEVIIPTLNERDNVAVLLSRMPHHADIERVIFVDDSDDGTPEAIEIAATGFELQVDVLHRTVAQRKGGLAGAVMHGLRSSDAPWVAVMDSDLQHPPEVLKKLIDRAAVDDVDLVVATRGNWASIAQGLGPVRRVLSAAAGKAAAITTRGRIKGVTDPLSGFFLVRRSALDLDQMDPVGFKILLEILVTHPELRIAEVGYDFDKRNAGKSKGTVLEGLRFGRHLARLRRSSRSS